MLHSNEVDELKEHLDEVKKQLDCCENECRLLTGSENLLKEKLVELRKGLQVRQATSQ